MKKLFTVFLLWLVSAEAFAASKRAILKMSLSDNAPITVAVDNRYYDKHGRTITIGDLPAGRHYVKIYEYLAYRDKSGGHARLLYEGYIRTRRGTVTTCLVNARNGRARISWTDEENFNDSYADEDRYADSRSRQFTQRDMEDLKARTNSYITDSDKLKFMQSVLSNRAYNTAQVREMMGWYSFDSTKLSFAKWAYTNVIDRNDYWKLEDAFSFSSSKEEFNDFISGK